MCFERCIFCPEPNGPGKMAECDFRSQAEKENETVFPIPGEFIPTVEHCYLDNNFYEFYVGEHVGFEVYDPTLDECAEGDAVYIYAVVIQEVKEGESDVPLLARRYLINLGPERGTAEVSVTKLYKFIRKARRGTSRELVPYAGGETPDPRSDRIPQPNMREVLKEIRKILTEAWRLPDEKDRMRVLKRLMLKWHPDKNKGNEEFSTRVFQKLKHYEELLKQKRSLPEDDDDVDGSVSSSGGCPPSPSGSTFSDFMFRRGRSYQQHYESDFSRSDSSRGRHGASYNSSDHSSSAGASWYEYHHSRGETAANPQPGEGRRWFRQAEADLAAAQTARGTFDRGHNWVCYQCHQAVEKALKAVLYSRDAGSYLYQSHDISSLARLVNDEQLCQLTRNLESRLGNHMRMRYPDVLVYPRIPSDVYTADDANYAFDTAQRVVSIANGLLQL